jgi:hypothetical protein
MLKTKHFLDRYISDFNVDPLIFGETKQSFINQWKQTTDTACERGTAIHAQLEQLANGGLIQTKIGKKFPNIDFNKQAIHNSATEKVLLSIDKALFPEFLIHRVSDDGILRVAG